MKKFHKLAALGAALALTLSFTTVAYAAETDNPANATVPSSPAAASDSSASSATSTPGTSNPFTPAGTGTVVNTATDADGKEFYTITTPDKNVFYLVIDRQRDGDNVYFLDAVTEKDLLALAQKSGDTGSSNSSVSEPESKPDTTSTPQTSETTAQKPTASHSNSMGMLLLVLAVVVIGGGAGYYFKIYRPKHQKTESEDDFDYGEENGPDDAEDSEKPDELPSSEDEDEENGGDEEA